MPKPSGGFRALSMLEEGFKALEGPVTKRLVERRRIEAMQLYSSTNQAYAPSVNAAAGPPRGHACLRRRNSPRTPPVPYPF